MSKDFYFNSNYAKIYKDIDGDSTTFTFECPYGKITNTFILRAIKWTIDGQKYYDIVTPYGYGGPYAENVVDIDKLMNAYKIEFTEYCKCHNIICEFIRFHLFDNIDIREHFYGETIQLLDNVVVDTTGDFIDKIWANYNRKVRKNVKKAMNNGLIIVIESNIDHLDGFLDIYYKTMSRNNANDYYYFKKEYFENIANFLPNNYIYFHVFKDGVMVSTELVFYSEKYAYSFLGGTLTEYYEYSPNDFLKNEIIKWCNSNGIEKFILGGGYHKDDGIYKYKRCFTSDPDIPFFIGRHIFNNNIYNKAVEIRKMEDPSFDESSHFFPLYRS